MSDQLRRSMIRTEASILDAMRSLEDSGSQIVVVVDERDRLVGILTDGDIRRAILGGASPATPVEPYLNRDGLTVTAAVGRADVLELMQARQISQIPVLGQDDRVVGLHLLHQMLSIAERPNRAVVMAGGRGSRLGPLTDTTPKPMLPVAGRPILERIVLHLVGHGIRHIYLSVNYLAEIIEAHFGDGRAFGCTIEYLRESEPLGTGGSLSLLPRGAERPAHPFLVMNGDLVTQADVGAMIDFHLAGGQVATMAVRHYFHQIPFGCVDVEGDRLVAFVEKPTTSRLVNAGIYLLDPSVLDLLNPAEVLTMPDLVDRVRTSGGTARVFETDEEWIDVGRHEELDRARRGG